LYGRAGRLTAENGGFRRGQGIRFPPRERDRLGLRGLLPPAVLTTRQQVKRFFDQFHSTEDPMQKWEMLASLQDRNETLFYKVITENIREMAPIVYTPTVGLACQHFSAVFRRPRGMYFSSADRGEMASMIYNWPADEVDVIVVTDGSRILGLGDLGVQGMGISIGKLVLYVAAGGLTPARVLPVCIDVGTNNQELLDDPLYLGLHQRRIEGQEYEEVIDEFMDAVYHRYPNVLVQFEDFQTTHANPLLEKYRGKYRMFNDDIQGTGTVALAAMLASMRALGRDFSAMPEQSFVVAGAGSAGIGIVDTLCTAMTSMYGLSEAQARARFWIVDHLGLLAEGRDDLTPDQAKYARADAAGGTPLLEVLPLAGATVLLGVSGAGPIFTEPVLQWMADNNEVPLLFPMSNPTSKAECTAEDAFTVSGGRCIFGSGSPFPAVEVGGKACIPNQANNMYIFPGLGLGTVICGARIVTDGMLMAAAKALASYPTDEEVAAGMIFPNLEDIRDVSAKVATAVIKQALAEGLVPTGLEQQLLTLSDAELEAGVVDRVRALPLFSAALFSTTFSIPILYGTKYVYKGAGAPLRRVWSSRQHFAGDVAPPFLEMLPVSPNAPVPDAAGRGADVVAELPPADLQDEHRAGG
jgi:malate dehydrogenase (decarboxylating)